MTSDQLKSSGASAGYTTPKVNAVIIEYGRIICGSGDQLQSYEEDNEQFRF